jgi:hypothetical protein
VNSNINQVMSMITAMLATISTTLIVRAQTPAVPSPNTPSNAPATAYTPDPITSTRQSLAGKLFFSDEDRSKINQIRKDGALPFDVIDGQPIERTSVLNGFIKRSDGATTYWVNGGNISGTRYVVGQGLDAEVVATSSMVGGEPKVLLSGMTVGEPKIKDKPIEKKAKNAPKKAQVKKSRVNKKVSVLKHNRITTKAFK